MALAVDEQLAQRALDALREVQDPEMPVNIVDLGIIYGVTALAGRVTVDLTFTAMGCPASDYILEDVHDALAKVEGVDAVDVRIVWDPPWSAARISDAGRDALEAWGLAL